MEGRRLGAGVSVTSTRSSQPKICFSVSPSSACTATDNMSALATSANRGGTPIL
jgi:hypothetical protein